LSSWKKFHEFSEVLVCRAGSQEKVTNDQRAYRYETLETLGRGSFGQVVRARDHKTGNIVALKNHSQPEALPSSSGPWK
uniref:Protein kinase domain-containing protein n=1 Tax=Macrostomum lignano TaxID=282301 RepID=A0A1I8JN31_9PLAT